ncbi:MAG: HAD family phosphatase [Nanoarchaeota archaeon]|nr:HAD family phosphatase [Nanoarchaeota archaeon]
MTGTHEEDGVEPADSSFDLEKQRFRGALLDVDNTLVDSERLHCLENIITFDKYGVQITPELHIKYWIAEGGRGTRGVMEDFDIERRYGVSLQEVRQFKDNLYSEKLVHEVKPMPGVPLFLYYLFHTGFNMAAVTTNYRQSTIAALNATRLDQYIPPQRIIAIEDVNNAKPHPEPYLKGAGLLGLHPSECFALEDTPKGAKSALDAGVGLVLVCSNDWTKALFTPEVEGQLRSMGNYQRVETVNKIVERDMI